MSANMKIVDPLKGLGPLTRPLYQPGLLLQDDDLTAAVQYTRDLNRLMFRTLFGCGVMCGLVVTPSVDCCKLHIGIAKGVALDCHGDPVDVPAAQDLVIDPACVPTPPSTLWIVLRGYEKNCAPRMPLCPDDDDTAVVCTRAREGFEIKVVTEPPKCSCQCDPSTDTVPTSTTSGGQLEVLAGHSGARRKQGRIIPAKGASPLAHEEATGSAADTNSCQCANPNEDCYRDHYQGNCSCDCCDCEWIVLARIDEKSVDTSDPNSKQYWAVDHSVRRFVRPVLVKDPQPPKDQDANTAALNAAKS